MRVWLLLLTLALAGCAAPEPMADQTLNVTSPAFAQGDVIPTQYTCDGDNISPRIDIGGIPDEATHLAVIFDDPDAPGGTWTHWLFWDLPVRSSLPEGFDAPAAGATEGTNSRGTTDHHGPCPPPPTGSHRYFWKAYAYDGSLGLAAGADADALRSALEDHVLARGELMGTYDRSG